MAAAMMVPMRTNRHPVFVLNIVELRGRSHAIYLADPYESVAVACSMFLKKNVLFRAVYY